MTEREYRAAEGISRSQLWKMSESPEKFLWAMEHPQEPTPALLFGQAAHKMMLEPDGWADEFAVAPIIDRRTKDGKLAWQCFADEAAGRSVISADDYETACAMVETAKKNLYVSRLLDGKTEEPVFWKDELTGELCKARLDCISRIGDKMVIVDYKTTADASTDAFMRSAVKYGYDFQAAMYLEGYKQTMGTECLFVFIAQEKVEPYSINILQADEVFLRRGYDIFRELLGTYHDCKQTGIWWGYLGKHNMINNLALPAWLAKEVE